MTCEMFSCAFGSYARVRSSYVQKINHYAKKQTYTKNNKPFLKKPALDPLPVCRMPLSPEYHLQPTRSENTLAYNIPVSNRDYHLRSFS